MASDILSDEILKETLSKAVKNIAREIYAEKEKISEPMVSGHAKTSLPDAYEQMVNEFKQRFESRPISNELTSRWLKKNTSFGQIKPAQKRQGTIDEQTKLRFDQRFPVLYSIIDRDILISHSGHVLVISNHAEIFASVIEKINQSTEFTPKEFFNQLQFAAINLETVKSLLQQLYSIRALDTV